VRFVEGAIGVAARFQSDVEGAAASITHLPLAEKMAAGRSAGRGRTRIAYGYAASARELDARHVGKIEGLAMAIFEDKHDLAGGIFACMGLGGCPGGSQQHNRAPGHDNDELAHRFSFVITAFLTIR
jgi:hypothetical protein